MKIAILGAGAFGTALGGILASKGYDIDYYDSKVERENLANVVEPAKYVVLCIPSNAVPYMLPHLPKTKSLIVATKGILSDLPFESFRDYMILSGPGFADDIKRKRRTLLTVTDSRIVDLFATEYMEFDFTDDRKGVLMCGALKNVYAILAGLKGLKRGTPEWVKFIRVVANEMRELLEVNGADPDTVDLACGVGDLKLTCGLPSRNYEYGSLLRDNPNLEPTKTVEGLAALSRIKRGEIEVPTGFAMLKEISNAIK